MGAKGFKRRKYFLKDSPQPVLILKIYLILIGVMFLSGTIFYFIGNKNLTNEFFQAHSVIKSTMQLLLPALVLVNIIGLLGAVALVVLFTHSIAGPVYRLKILSEKISSGGFTQEVKFRRRDELQELAGAVNSIVKGLNLRLQNAESCLHKLQALSLKVKNMDKLSKDELVSLKESLLAASGELQEKIKKLNS